jgi:hypothetical protein
MSDQTNPATKVCVSLDMTHRLQLAVIVLVALAAACVPAGADGPAGAASPPVAAEAARVSLEAHDTPLSAVFADLSAQSKVDLIYQATQVPKVTLALADRPLREVIDTLADLFELVAQWDKGTLILRALPDALKYAGDQLAAGDAGPLNALADLATGRQPLHGSAALRQKLADALKALIAKQANEITASNTQRPDEARALAGVASLEPGTRWALLAYAVLGYVRESKLDLARATWEEGLKGQRTWQAAFATAELLLALSYTNAAQAQAFFAESFDVNTALAMLDEGWRQHQYRAALHLARLSVSLAQAAGRNAEAQALSAAIEEYLDSRRTVSVTCAVDADAATDPRADEKVRTRVAQVSEVFERTANIAFNVDEMMRWDPPSDNDFDRLHNALKAALGKRHPELTVGFILEVFTAHPATLDLSHQHLWMGFGCPHMGPYLLARDFSFEYTTTGHTTEWTLSPGSVAETLIHEMGHMFGALHVDDESSVMRPVSRDVPCHQFDELNTRIIQLHRWQDMAHGAESLDEPELLALVQCYRQLRTRSKNPNGADEEEARVHLALAKLYRERHDPARAADRLRAVLEIGAPPEVVAEAQKLLSTP